MNFEQWHKEYFERKIANVKKELNERDIEILLKLGITVEDKIYTEYELESLTIDIGAYYKDNTMSELDLEYVKDLDSTGVTLEEYNYISDKIDKIYDKFSKYFAKYCPSAL